MKLSARVSRISVSQTLAAAEAARQLRARGIDVVDFGPGEPDFDTPDNVRRAGIRAIEDGFTRYTATAGTLELRQAIVQRHATDFGSSYDPTECMACAGGKHALYNAFQTLVEEGDEALIPAPYWVSFGDIARLAGATPVFLETDETNGFQLTAAMVERAITPRTRLLVMNSPNNPSGAVMDKAEFVRIAEVCQARGIVLLSDECYSRFLFEGRKLFSIGSVKAVKNSVVVAGSLSKTYAMMGWRLGYLLGPKHVIDAALKLQGHSITNPTSVSQRAAIEALSGPQDSVDQMLAEYAKRRKYVLERVRAIPELKCATPYGAFYVYPNVSSTFARGIKDSVDFAVKLLEQQHVAVVPGSAFGTANHVRISYATSMERIEKGFDRIAQFVKG